MIGEQGELWVQCPRAARTDVAGNLELGAGIVGADAHIAAVEHLDPALAIGAERLGVFRAEGVGRTHELLARGNLGVGGGGIAVVNRHTKVPRDRAKDSDLADLVRRVLGGLAVAARRATHGGAHPDEHAKLTAGNRHCLLLGIDEVSDEAVGRVAPDAESDGAVDRSGGADEGTRGVGDFALITD